MGLFDKKKSADQPTAEPSAPSTQKATPAGATAASPAPAPPEPAYGIRQAIELMRGLPSDNGELVVHVVKKTLASLGIRVETIVEDANQKQSEIETRIATLKEEIAELDHEIQIRREEIARLDADCREIVQVRERLLAAERLSQAPAQTRPGASVDARPSTAPPPLRNDLQQARIDSSRARSDSTPLDLPSSAILSPAAPRTTGQHAISSVSSGNRPTPGTPLTPKK